jgi:hypothetical protein
MDKNMSPIFSDVGKFLINDEIFACVSLIGRDVN